MTRIGQVGDFPDGPTALAGKEVALTLKSFIAVRKPARHEAGGRQGANVALATMAPRERYRYLQEEGEQSSKRAKRLEDLGLTPLRPEADKQLKLPSDDGFFSRLGFAGAYVVSTINGKQAEHAEKILQDDYLILPNLPMLTIPPTVRTEVRNFADGRHAWPKHSGVALAHEEGIKGGGVRIMVLDTGCDAGHKEFKGKRVNFRYVDPIDPRKRRAVMGFDTHGHGTHVCGIIAGQNVGIAPAAELYVASVIESETLLTSLDRVMYGLDWLLQEVVSKDTEKPAILNLSLGFRPANITATKGARILERGLQSIITRIVDDFDVLVVVAAGNDGAKSYRIPAIYPEVVSVGAVDSTGKPAQFSCRGKFIYGGKTRSFPAVWGYGVNIYSSLERDEEGGDVYAEKSGTSMAAPFVTGIAALLAHAEELRGKALGERLLETLDGVGVPAFRLRPKQ